MVSKQTYGKILVSLFLLSCAYYGYQLTDTPITSFFQLFCFIVYGVSAFVAILIFIAIISCNLYWLCFKSDTVGFIEYWKKQL